MMFPSLIYSQEKYEPGVILVKLNNPQENFFSPSSLKLKHPEIQNILSNSGIQMVKGILSFSTITDGWFRLNFPENVDVESLKDKLRQFTDFQYVTLNYAGILATNDQHWNKQWALQKIGIEESWNYTTGSADVLVGIMDTGINTSHIDLQGMIWVNPDEIPGNEIDDDDNDYVDDINGWDYFENNNNIDDNIQGTANYHGTRIAGVIGAKTNNNQIGVAGIAGGWNGIGGVRLVGLRIVDPLFGFWYQDFAVSALLYLIDLKNRGYSVVANMSFSSPLSDSHLSEFKTYVEAAVEAGVIIVASAGNILPGNREGYDTDLVSKLQAPARWPGVISVGASVNATTPYLEEKSSYSQYTIGGNELLLVAPVDDTPYNIVTTYNESNYYYQFHGTSAAAPIVAGTIALMLSHNPNMQLDEIKQVLTHTAEKIGSYDYISNPQINYTRADEVGAGRLNAGWALAYTDTLKNLIPSIPSAFSVFRYQGLNPNRPKITWSYNGDLEFLDHFVIMRKINNGNFEQIGGEISASATSYIDYEILIWNSANFNTAYYKMKSVAISGAESNYTQVQSIDFHINFDENDGPSDIIMRSKEVPDKFILAQNYPNPFNPTSTISFGLPEGTEIEIQLFNIKGQEVKTIFKGYKNAGMYQLLIDLNNLPSGSYFYRLVAPGFSKINKLTLIK